MLGILIRRNIFCCHLVLIDLIQKLHFPGQPWWHCSMYCTQCRPLAIHVINYLFVCCCVPLIYAFPCVLTRWMLGPGYLARTRSIPCLLMSWLLASPGHQQTWHWLDWIHRSLSSMRKVVNDLHQHNLRYWKWYILFPSNNSVSLKVMYII